MTRTQSASSLALALLLAAGSLPAQQETDDFGRARATTLAAVRATPQAFKNVWIRFSGWFSGIGALHNPFFTRFTRTDYVNFALWGDTQKLWVEDEYKHPCTTLFVLKSNDKAVDLITSLGIYQRVTCTGIVRNVFRGEPWIEVTRIEVQPERLTTATLAHLARARRFMKKRQWAQAAMEVQLAQAAGQTPFIEAWLNHYLAVCYMRVGKIERAKEHIAYACQLVPEELAFQDVREQLRVDPKSVVDDKVSETRLPKAKRPMWEAYEEARRESKPAPQDGGTPAPGK